MKRTGAKKDSGAAYTVGVSIRLSKILGRAVSYRIIPCPGLWTRAAP